METRRTWSGANRDPDGGPAPFSTFTNEERNEAMGDAPTAYCVLVKMERPKDGFPPGKATFNNEVIPTGMTPYTHGMAPVMEAYVVARGEALIFTGRRSKGEGWTESEALILAERLTEDDMTWVGEPMQVKSRALTLEVGAKRIKECIRDRRAARLKERRPTERRNNPTQDQEDNRSEVSFHSAHVSHDGDEDDNQTESGQDSDTASQVSHISEAGSNRSQRRRRARADGDYHHHGIGKMKLNTFRGDPGDDHKAVPYRDWRFDVELYRRQEGVRERNLLPQVVASLKGPPGQMARSLGMDVNLDEILECLDNYYGNVLTYHGLSREMYTLKQQKNEDVSSFGVRVNKVIALIADMFPEKMPPAEKRDRILDAFYEGLVDEFKTNLAYLKAKPDINYQTMLKAARALEDKDGHHRQKNEPRDNKHIPAIAGRRNPGYHGFSRSARAELVELGKMMLGKEESPASSSCEEEETDEESGGEEEIIQMFRGVVEHAKTKNYWDKFTNGSKDRKSKMDLSKIECYNCRGKGHMSKECPSPRVQKSSKNEQGEEKMTKSPQTPSRSNEPTQNISQSSSQ